MTDPQAVLDLALACMRDHLLNVSTDGARGRHLSPHYLRSVVVCIRVLRSSRAKSPKSTVADASWKDLMSEAAKYPELAEAIAAMGGDK